MRIFAPFLVLAAAFCTGQPAQAANLLADFSTGWTSGMWRTYSFRADGGPTSLLLRTSNCNPMPMASMRVRFPHVRSGQVAFEGPTTYMGFEPACHHKHVLRQDILLLHGDYRVEVTADNSCQDARRCSFNIQLTDQRSGHGHGHGNGWGRR